MDKEHAAVNLAYGAAGGVATSFALSFVSEELALAFFVLAVLVGSGGIAVAFSIARDNSRVGEAHTVPTPPIPYDHQPLAYAAPPPPAAPNAVEPHTDSMPDQPADNDGWGL
jgi:hypothetical protein